MENTAFVLEPREMMPVAVVDRVVMTELASDFTLPDYLPEVRRLLRVVPEVQPESRYLGAASAEFGGACCYMVTYAGADGCLWSTQLREDYTVTVPLDAEALAQGLDPVADTAVDSIVSRVTGPRKLNIRTRLRTQVRGWGSESVEPEIEGGLPTLERLMRPGRAMRVLRGTSEPIDLGDEVTPGEATGLRVIRADGCVCVGTATTGQGEVICRGELVLNLLTCNEIEGMVSDPVAVTRKLPFEVRVVMSDVVPAMMARAWGRCSDLAAQVEEGRILCDAAVTVEAEAVEAMELSLTADAFATDGELAEAVWREVELSTPIRCGNYSFPFDGQVVLKGSGIDPAAEVIDVSAVPTVEGIETADGRCKLVGSCRLSVVYRAGGEYAVGEVSLPFGAAVDCGDGVPTDYAAALCVASLRVRCEGEGDGRRLIVDGELSGGVRLFSREKQRVLARAVYHPNGEAKQPGITVCYPEAGESLWAVCRRYHAPCADVAAANQLRGDALDSPDSLAGVRYLLI